MFRYMMLYSSFSAWISHFLACMGTSVVVDMALSIDSLENICVEIPLVPFPTGPTPSSGAQKGAGLNFEQSRGCFSCCSKSQPIIPVDEPSKGLRMQGKLVRKPSISDDFWSTSTCEMEISAVQSQRSMSSISISNQSTGNASNNNEFVNHGYLLWNQTRHQWLASKNPEN